MSFVKLESPCVVINITNFLKVAVVPFFFHEMATKAGISLATIGQEHLPSSVDNRRRDDKLSFIYSQ